MYGLREWIGLFIIDIFVALAVGRFLAILIYRKLGPIRILNNVVIAIVLSILLPFAAYQLIYNLGLTFIEHHVTLSL